jgi:hypothetical protein
MADDGTTWDCKRCTATAKSGRRCKRRTCKYADMCFQHTEQKKGLKIKKSTIPRAGMGLFTTKPIGANARIAKYGGPLVPRAQFEAADSKYGLTVTNALVMDGSSTQSGLGRWANDCRRTNRENKECKDNNARLVVANDRTASLKAGRRPIPAGSEIMVAYGANYWRAQDRANRAKAKGVKGGVKARARDREGFKVVRPAAKRPRGKFGIKESTRAKAKSVRPVGKFAIKESTRAKRGRGNAMTLAEARAIGAQVSAKSGVLARNLPKFVSGKARSLDNFGRAGAGIKRAQAVQRRRKKRNARNRRVLE